MLFRFSEATVSTEGTNRDTIIKSRVEGEGICRKYGGEIYVKKEYPQLEYLSDIPAVYEFCGYKTLSLPGAYSIDKWYRLMHGWPWFEGEMLTEYLSHRL